ncbi:MAG: GYF domain-containing protein [Roseibacillus sp.]
MWYFELNGTQQGPEETERVLQRLRNGELSSSTLVWREGMGDWQPLYTVAELVQENQVLPANHSPTSIGMPQPPQGYPGTGMMPVQNGMALTSMILAISSVVLTLGCLVGFILAVPAVIFGHIARKQIRDGAHMQTGDSMALAGLIIGYIVLGLFGGMCIFFVVLMIMGGAGGSSFP